MKKLLLTAFALLAVITLSAQTNLTEGKTVVPLGGLKTYNNGTADYTINNDDLQKIAVAGNTDNVYLFPEGGGYASDANIALGIQGFYIDLGESKSIGAIRSTWEGAAAGGNIYVTDSQPAADGTLTGETLIATFTNAQETAKNVAVSVTNSGRYLVFVPTEATNYAWGVKIRTFVALEKESSVLTSLLVSPTTVKVGEPTEMTFTPQDQLGLALTGATYSVTNATLEGTTLTATAAGDVQVTATIGDVSVSTTIKAISVSNPTTNPDEPEDLTANVIALYSSKYGKGLNENNPGWGVGGGAPNPLYTSLEEVEIADGHKSVHVKGTGFNNRTQNGVAVSADYTTIHVALYPFSATECKIFGDNAYGNAITKTGLVPGQWNYVSVPNDGITQNYICIELVGESEFYLDHFYFAKPAADDSQAPVLDVAELVNTGIGSATLRLKATDDKSAQVTYVITDNNNKTYTTKGDSGAEVTYTITGLLPGTSYTFSVVAQDDNENKSGAQTINASTAAWTAAPQPTLDATEVYALYSDAYTDIHHFSYQVWWGGQAKQEEVEPVAGDKVWHITDFLFLGTEHDEVDASQFEKLHLDVMPVSEDMTLGVTPVNAAEDANLYVNTPTLTANQWNAVEISIEDFKAAGLSMTRAYQIKLTGANGQNGTGQEFYLDNIYYVKGEGGDEPVEQATSGEETAIIESTLPEVNGKELKYTWAFTQEGKNVTITFACTNASEIPGIVDGYIHDKTDGFAESAGLTKTWSNCTEGQILKVAHKWEFAGGAFVTPDFTYKVKAAGDEPEEPFVLTAAPAPTQEAADVMSIYSDAYSPATTYNYGSWGQSTAVATETVEGNEMLKLTNYNYLGLEYATDLDISEMTHIHIDVLPMQAMKLGITPIMRGGTVTEKSTSVGTLNVKEWNSIDLPIADFGFDLTNKTFQLKIDQGTGTEVVYIDNIYFYKEGGDEPVEPEVTSGEGSYTIPSGMNEGKELKYTWAFTQTGKDVTVTFACTNKDDIVGIVDGYVFDKTDGFAEHEGLTYTWTNCTEGQKVTAAHKWMFAEGDFITPDFTYTVKAEGDIPQESIVKTVQLLGTWNWDVSVDNLTLTKQADANVWTGTLDLTDIYGDQEFKLVVNGGGDESDNWAGWIGTNKVTVEAPAEWGVFSGTEDNMNMTLNHGKTGYKTYTITATWTEGDNYYEGWTLKIEGKDKADLFVKFVNGKQWNEVYAYTWGVIDVSWPGYKLEKTGTETINGTEYDVYTWNLPAEITGVPQYVIFSDGTGGTDGETQTHNLEFVNGKTYYDMVPVPATIYSIVGELTGGWDADADMTQDADNENIYTLVVEDFEATAEGYQYKLRKNHQWGEGEIPATGNYTWNPEEVGATYDLTFTFNLSEGTLTLDAVKQSAPIVLDTEALDAEIAAAEDLIKDVDQTEGPAKTLADAIAAAKEAKSAATTQDDITTALQTLQTAVAAYKTTTGINTIKLNPADGIIYDLSGRRVLNPAKGIYIQNGRRVVIK